MGMAAVALFKTYEQTTLSQVALNEQRRLAAIELVGSSAVSLTTKFEAVRSLMFAGDDVVGLELNCDQMDESCGIVRSVVLATSNDEGRWIHRADLRRLTFEDVTFNGAGFANVQLDGARFLQTTVVESIWTDVSLSKAFLDIEWGRGMIDTSDLTSADLSHLRISNARIVSSLIDDAKLCGLIAKGESADGNPMQLQVCGELSHPAFSDAYYTAGHRPDTELYGPIDLGWVCPADFDRRSQSLASRCIDESTLADPTVLEARFYQTSPVRLNFPSANRQPEG